MKAVLTYLYTKLVGSGFVLAIFTGTVLIMTRFDMYELSMTLQSPWIWVAFYPYAIAVSILVDKLMEINYASKVKRKYISLIAYQIFGFIPFVFMMFPSILLMIVAGLVGVFCASVFYVGSKTIVEYQIASHAFAYILPVMLVIVMMTDYTEKVHWQEVTTNSSYQVVFDYFNGTHDVSIPLEKGEILVFEINVYYKNGGGSGYYVRGPYANQIPLEFEEPNRVSDTDVLYFRANESGVYDIVISGSKLEGAIYLEWNILDHP